MRVGDAVPVKLESGFVTMGVITRRFANGLVNIKLPSGLFLLAEAIVIYRTIGEKSCQPQSPTSLHNSPPSPAT